MKVMTFNIQHALDYQKQIIDTGLFVDAIKKNNLLGCFVFSFKMKVSLFS